jgi:thiol-disulfide isomerase/thioredoxin
MRMRTRRLALIALLSTAAALPAVLAPHDASAQGVQARPWLGLAMDGDASAAGVRVGHVIRGSPADGAGIHEGDRIVGVAGHRVGRARDVVDAVAGFAVGDSVEIAFVRAGASQTTRATLAAFPSQDQMLRMDLIGAFAPAWKDLQVVSGTFPPSVGDSRGRVVVLDFWATWCMPCRVVIPKLDALQAQYGAQGLSVLGVSTEETQDVSQFVQNMAMRYGVAVDRHGQTTRGYGVVSLPTLIVIDKRGVVRDVAVGYDPSGDARLEATVRTLLAEPAPPR